jgi:hypothetical protein
VSAPAPPDATAVIARAAIRATALDAYKYPDAAARNPSASLSLSLSSSR